MGAEVVKAMAVLQTGDEKPVVKIGENGVLEFESPDGKYVEETNISEEIARGSLRLESLATDDIRKLLKETENL